MDSLVKDSIYSKVAVFDHQGACVDDKSHYSDAASYLSVCASFSRHSRAQILSLWLRHDRDVVSFQDQ